MLQTTTNIDVDFYDKKYILINAKQLDKGSRFLSVTCYNHGELYSLNEGEHSAYIRYRKADNNSVFNSCEIDRKGKIMVELTEQMLAADGICYADLVIVTGDEAIVNANTGEITGISGDSILSTMTFCIDVSETAVENSDIESSYEFNGLNEALIKAEAKYSQVIRLAESYALGGTAPHPDGRENEDKDNAKYYYEQSKKSADDALEYKDDAFEYKDDAFDYMTEALIYKGNAETFMGQAKTYMSKASVSENNARVWSTEGYLQNYADDGIIVADETKTIGAKTSAKQAENSAVIAQRYAVGGTGSVNGEDVDNAKYYYTESSKKASDTEQYYLQTEAIVNGLNGAFLPKGTITFAELAELKESGTIAAGYLYNISDNFTTDDTFRMGAGVEYEAGTNVYYTADGEWDCLAGTTVTGVKGGAETTYRKGNVDITAENVGAIPTANIATVDEIKTYLGIN